MFVSEQEPRVRAFTGMARYGQVNETAMCMSHVCMSAYTQACVYIYMYIYICIYIYIYT